LKNESQKVSPTAPRWSPQASPNQQKNDKNTVPELVLKNVQQNREKPCPQNLKNSVFAWEGLHFQGFQHLQK
jgi:hypothetical protein